METLPSRKPTPPPERLTPVNGRVGPAGSRDQTAWNSTDRQRHFGSLDLNGNASPPPAPGKPPRRRRGWAARSRPTWPIGLIILAALTGGIVYLAKHPAPASTTTDSSSDENDRASVRKKRRVSPEKKSTTRRAVHHPDGPSNASVTETPVRPASERHAPVADAPEPAPRRPREVVRPQEVRPRPHESAAVPVAAAKPKPSPPPASVARATPHPHAPAPDVDTASKRASDLLNGN